MLKRKRKQRKKKKREMLEKIAQSLEEVKSPSVEHSTEDNVVQSLEEGLTSHAAEHTTEDSNGKLEESKIDLDLKQSQVLPSPDKSKSLNPFEQNYDIEKDIDYDNLPVYGDPTLIYSNETKETDKYLEQPSFLIKHEENVNSEDDYDDNLKKKVYDKTVDIDTNTEEEYDDDCRSDVYFYETDDITFSGSEDNSRYRELKNDYVTKTKPDHDESSYYDDYSDRDCEEDDYNDGKNIVEENINVRLGCNVYAPKHKDRFDYESDATYYDTEDSYDSEAIIEDDDNYEDEQTKADSYDDDVPYHSTAVSEVEEVDENDNNDEVKLDDEYNIIREPFEGDEDFQDICFEGDPDLDEGYNVEADNKGKVIDTAAQDWDPEVLARENEEEEFDKEYECKYRYSLFQLH